MCAHTAKVLNTENLLGYQEGSVVSRELVKEDGGTVTVFAFAKGEGLSEHTAPYDAFVYLLEGEAQITINGNTFHLKKGEMIIMPANDPHALKAVEEFKMLLVMIKV